MTKKELRKRLLDAGLPEDAVDVRLNALSDAELKEYDDVPFAEVLKEFSGSEEDEVVDLDEVVKEVTDSVKSSIGDIVEEKMKEVLANFELTVSDLGDLEVDMKELGEFVAMKEAFDGMKTAVEALTAKVDALVKEEDERVKEAVEEMPRSSKLRIRRYKACPPGKNGKGKGKGMDDEESDAEDEGEDGEEKELEEGVVLGANGERASSMTEWLVGSNK